MEEEEEKSIKEKMVMRKVASRPNANQMSGRYGRNCLCDKLRNWVLRD